MSGAYVKEAQILKKTQMRFALCLLLSAALLGGCSQKPVGEDLSQIPLPTLNTGPLISPPTTSTAPVTQPTEEDPPALEPVTLLSCVKWSTLPQLLNLGEGAVLACRNDHQEGKGTVNYLQVLDVYQDRVSAQSENDGSRELVEQRFEDGYFIVKDPLSGNFFVYDRTLQIKNQFSAPNMDGYFSQNRKEYYFVQNNVLYRMDVASGNYARMKLDQNLRLSQLVGVHPARDMVIAKCYLSFHNDTTGVCAIDCKTGKYLLLNKSISQLWFDGDTFYAAETNSGIYGSDILYGTLTDGLTHRISTALLGSDTVSYTMLPGSGILLHRTVDEKNLSTTVYDLSKGGISSKLAQYEYTTSTLGAVYLQQEQLIFGVYPQETEFLPVVIDPKVLSYEKSLSINKASWPALIDRNAIMDYEAEVAGPALPQQLQQVRLQADALEKKHGISIRMENQILSHCSGDALVNGDPAAIGTALNILDQELSRYPEGFLKQFQNSIGEGGLYFLLSGTVQGSLDPVGKAAMVRNRYELTLDITAPRLAATVHHELWHAIEMKLSTDRFEEPRWHAANPKGFTYYGKYDSGYQQLTRWTYEQSGEQCHFVDAYSRINSREDRARLMEYVMTGDASELLRSAALRAKLELMSEAIREQFNTTGWQTPLWEQYL